MRYNVLPATVDRPVQYYISKDAEKNTSLSANVCAPWAVLLWQCSSTKDLVFTHASEMVYHGSSLIALAQINTNSFVIPGNLDRFYLLLLSP